MSKYRNALPQLNGGLFLTDGGLETTLVFHHGLDLPHFASFPLMEEAEGLSRLSTYYEEYIAIAKAAGAGFILESVSWRANLDWGHKLGYKPATLAEANRQSIAMMEALRDEHETETSRMVISGCIGPRGDGYVVGKSMSANESADYHGFQVDVFAATAADMVSAFTMNYADEATGVVLAAKRVGIPVVISFTVETDGRLPSGQSLPEAIAQVDAATDGYTAYFMINCAHPTHFEDALPSEAEWTQRLRGLRANSSCKSHAELDESNELDEGNPAELSQQYAALLRRHPHINILGGCCGTDHRHIAAIAQACGR